MNQPELWRTLRWVLPLGAGLVSVAVGVLLGIELAILVLAGSVLVGVIFVLWNSVQGLTGEGELSLDEALSLAAPSAPEEEKRSVLRTLKDLEYERSVGKISEADYAELAARYSARAKELIQAVDADIGQAKEEAERLLAKRLGADKAQAQRAAKQRRPEPEGSRHRKAAPRQEPDDDDDTAPPASEDEPDDAVSAEAPDSVDAEAPEPARSGPGRIECPECTTANEPDARFCKSCGNTLEAAS